MNARRGIRLVVIGLAMIPQGVAPGADDPFQGNACVQCHRDMPGRSSAIVDLEWKQSSHYTAGVGCDACHGGNAAAPRERFESDEAWKEAAHLSRDPEFMFVHRSEGAFVAAARGRSVSYFCGKCHGDIKEKHLGSPHGEFGDPTCLYCHGAGSHAIGDPTLEIIDLRSRAEGGRCRACHLDSTMETVSRIKTSLAETEERIRDSAGLFEDLEAWGYKNLELEQLHHDAKQVRSQLRQVFHSFNLREINNFTAEIQLMLDRATATHEMISRLRNAQHRQAVVGGGLALMLLAFALLLVYYRHAFHAHRPGRGAAVDPSPAGISRSPRVDP